MRSLALSFFIVVATCAVEVQAENSIDTTPTGAVDLQTAVRLALERSPVLEAMSARVGQAVARRTQAALLPNPALRFELEDFAGSGPFDGADQAQATFTVEQPLEIGGKRSSRIGAATASATITKVDYESTKRDVVAATTRAFIELQSAQSSLELADEAVHVADEIFASVGARVRAGSSSRVELSKAEVVLAEARINRQRTERALAIAGQRLAETWGDTEPRFTRAIGEIGTVRSPPGLTTLLANMSAVPAIRRAADEVTRREAGVTVAQANAIPNVDVGVGYRRLEGPDEHAMVAELRVPLPLFDRNQGSILEARERVAGALAEQRGVEARVTADLRALHEALTIAYDELEALDATVLPAANRAFATIRDGYREGRFSYLDLLDAQRTLNAARIRRIDVVAAYHIASAEITRLTGEGASS